MKFLFASLCVLLTAFALASAQLNPSDYTLYADSTVTHPANLQLFTGGLEIMDGTPAPSTPSAEFRRDFLLHTLNSTTPYWLDFSQFHNASGNPPFNLHWTDVITVLGVLEHDLSNPHAIPTITVYTIGVQRDLDMVTPVPTTYAPVSSESIKALFVLMNFADGQNNCDQIAPSGITGKDFLNSLAYTGTYHNGKSIQQLYSEMSNGRLTLANSDIVGPWDFPQFATSDKCDSDYVTWQSAAKSKAAQMGYDLSQYGTIVIVVPASSSCYWAGRATLSNACKPTATTPAYSSPPCATTALMCQQFVIGHELGHNLGMYHSAIDTSNSDMVPDSNTYLDWSDLMGNRATWTKLNAVKMLSKGYLKSSRVRMIASASDAATYTLDSLDMSDASSSNPSVLYFTDTTGSVTKTYYFSYRSTLGYSSNIESKYTLGVNVHYFRSNGAGQSYYVKTLTTGATFTAPSTGFTFTVMSLDGTRAQLKVSCPTCSNSGTPNPTPITYSWSTGLWSSCSKTCGSGTQTRTVSCIASNTNSAVDGSYCTFAGTQPATSQSCNTQACTTTYTWSIGAWSTCNAGTSCGASGIQTRSVTCMSSGGYAVTDGTCSLTVAKPATYQTCTGSCDGVTVTYSWATTSFSSCSVTCGTGNQTRTVYCLGSDGKAAADTSCDSASKPAAIQSCTQAACTVDTNTCGSVNCGDNGNCVTPTSGSKYCQCLNGYTGASCTIAPSLSNVQVTLNADGTISITWSTVGSYGTINIYLNSLASLPLLVGSGVPNSGSFTFNAASFSPAVGQYYVMIQITATVKSSSATFTLSGCNYMNCGTHGSCSSGVCICSDGYTGSSCQTAPVNPCDNSPCLNGGSCHVVGGVATCDCSTALNSAGKQYTGTTCQTAPAATCTRNCNSGYANSACSGCVCSGQFSGSNCQICNLAQYNKCVYGYPNAGCTACVCPAGYTGTYCDSKITSAIVSNLVLPRTALETEDALITFKESFASDLSKALNISALRIQVKQVVPTGDSNVEEIYNVLFNILSLPARLFNGTSYSAPAADLVLNDDEDSSNDMIVPTEGTDPNLVVDIAASALDDLNNIANSLTAALANPNSALYLGEITSQLTYGSSTLTVSDPSLQTPSSSSPESTLGTGAIVGVCVAGVALIALAAVGTHIYCKGKAQRGADSPVNESSVSKSVSFTTVPQSIVRSNNSSSSSRSVTDNLIAQETDENADDHVLEISTQDVASQA